MKLPCRFVREFSRHGGRHMSYCDSATLKIRGISPQSKDARDAKERQVRRIADPISRLLYWIFLCVLCVPRGEYWFEERG